MFAVAVVAATCGVSCGRREVDHPRVIVIGFDGMDPRLCERMIEAGELPNLARMRERGGYQPLGTTIPPQSPVAWATFITGANPGVHGIFDFIHRDPAQQCAPYYSAADTVAGDRAWEVDGFRIPLTFWPFHHRAPQTRLRRGGTPFWDYLDRAGVPVRMYDIPANYPPSESHHGHTCCLAGMGVPDLLGGYGTYQYFSEDTYRAIEESGGMRRSLFFENDTARGVLIGPNHPYVPVTPGRTPRGEVDFTIHRHPGDDAARIELQEQTIVLRAGEWSDWQPVEFALGMPSFLPTLRVSGIVRFYLMEVRPTFRLYVTPINIDPSDPGDQKISEPPGFVTDIAGDLGLFYTAGFQEDHKALSNRIFEDAEFHQQADYVLKERLDLLEYAKANYENGLLFFYFSSTDLQAHMFWWDGDEKHPVRTPEEAKRYHGAILDLYRRMDAVVGDVWNRYGDDATVIVMSDHGFCNFRRQFNVNTWLRDNGYLQPSDAKSLLNPRSGKLVDWTKTRAYGLGLNGLYLNLRGRERDGVVNLADRDQLLRDISEKLLDVRDPESGQPIIARVYRADEIYKGEFVKDAPDLLIGYRRGYRASWAATLGDMTEEVISDNASAWSADHCIAAEEVPGVVFSNKPIRRKQPSLVDLAPTILELFNVSVPATMEGGSLFTADSTARAITITELPQ
jgi:predicted AlkP superfamily phosphohydrolase/phosphomutase